MEHSYGEGYVPTEADNKISLVVPFTADGALKDNTLTVTVGFKETKETPFQLKNYQADVKLQTVTFKEEQADVYLYTVDLFLQEERHAGQYPVSVQARGIDGEGNQVTLEYVIFTNVTGAGRNQQDKEHPEDPENQETPEAETGGEGKILPPEAGGDTMAPSAGSGEESVVHQPKFILEESSLDGIVLDAGSSREMQVTFRNKSSEFAACNVKVSLAAEGEESNLTFGRTSEYFEKVQPGKAITFTEELRIQTNAPQGNVPVKFSFEYEDEKGTAYMGTESLVLQIRQPARVSLSNCSIPSSVYSTDTISTDMQILNLGKAPVYNVRVSAKGAGIFALQTFYAGTLEAGQSIQGSMELYAGAKNMESINDTLAGTDEEKYGKVDGALVLAYEDVYGQTYSQEVNYKTEIQPPKILSLKPEKKEQETNQWWVSVLVLAGAGLLGILLIQTLRIRGLKKNNLNTH